MKQWTDVHGLPNAPTMENVVDGYPRQVWSNGAGEELIESYTIPDMAHGTPLAVGNDADQCGAAGASLLDVGISSSYHIAKFWGIAATPLVDSHDVKGERMAPPAGKRADRAAKAAAAGASRSLPDIRAIIAQALEAAGLTKAP